MLGKDLYKIDGNVELFGERLKALVFFYGPLVGNDALALYEYLAVKSHSANFRELNELLMSLNLSVDLFETLCGKLNEYRLLKTLKKDNSYVLVLCEPLTASAFIKDGILAREFILKTSGTHYQELIADIYEANEYEGYENVSKVLPVENLNSWTPEDETYLNKKPVNTDQYSFNTLFDVGRFLKDISTNLFPLPFRTKDNLKQIAEMADLYDISYDRMRSYVAETVNRSSESFNMSYLKYLCMHARGDYKNVEKGKYNVPCLTYLMSLQDGKEVTENDRKIIMNLSQEYHLNHSVINVLLEHALRNCDNRLIEKYLYPIASDLHRNDVSTAQQALERLNRNYERKTQEDRLPVYDTGRNTSMSDEEAEELLKLMGKK
ncbi:MAG: DnaD domain protein [Erysipelotrichaceae bacterium]|nr:DnaD domain protein [Erysipelotrichaceae bacterium]